VRWYAQSGDLVREQRCAKLEFNLLVDYDQKTEEYIYSSVTEDWSVKSSSTRAQGTADGRVMVTLEGERTNARLEVYLHGKRQASMKALPLCPEWRFYLDESGYFTLLRCDDDPLDPRPDSVNVVTFDERGREVLRFRCPPCRVVSANSDGTLVSGGQGVFFYARSAQAVSTFHLEPHTSFLGWGSQSHSGLFAHRDSMEASAYSERLTYLDVQSGQELWATELPGYADQTAMIEDILLVSCLNRFPAYASDDDRRENPIWQFVVALSPRDGMLLGRWVPDQPSARVQLMRRFDQLYAVADHYFGRIDVKAVTDKTEGWR
jgi:hypothetical protein